MKLAFTALSFAILLSGCATSAEKPSREGARLALSDDLQCRILADVGQALAADNYDPQVVGENEAKVDCTSAFQSAGLPMTGDQKRGVRFHAPQFSGDDEAVVPVDFYCLALCGHGEDITLHREGSMWKIADRKPTWIS